MWVRGQNFDRPVKDKTGRTWHFRVWSEWIDGLQRQRIYFWDDGKTDMGMVEFTGDSTLNMTRLKQQIAKIMSNSEYRRNFNAPLKFPVERHY